MKVFLTVCIACIVQRNFAEIIVSIALQQNFVTQQKFIEGVL